MIRKQVINREIIGKKQEDKKQAQIEYLDLWRFYFQSVLFK